MVAGVVYGPAAVIYQPVGPSEAALIVDVAFMVIGRFREVAFTVGEHVTADAAAVGDVPQVALVRVPAQGPGLRLGQVVGRQLSVCVQIGGHVGGVVVGLAFDDFRCGGLVSRAAARKDQNDGERQEQFSQPSAAASIQIVCLVHLYLLVRQPDDLPIEQHIAVHDDTVVMVVAEEPPAEVQPAGNLVEEVGQPVMLVAAIRGDEVLDAAADAVGHDVIDLPSDPFQAGPGRGVFRVIGQLLAPPGAVGDTVQREAGVESLLLGGKVGVVGIEDAVGHVVAAGPTHGEEGMAVDVIDLSAHQVDERAVQVLDLSAVPAGHGQLGQPIVVGMVARDEQRRERHHVETGHGHLLGPAAVPYAEVAADDDEIVLGHVPGWRETGWFEA